jgi:plasmid stabilization system protein ParE
MFDHRAPADELALIRAEIARLKRREAALREAYLTRADMPKIGRWNKVEIHTKRHAVFDPRLLPAAIRNDPAYQRDKVMRVLRTAPNDRAAKRLPDITAPAHTQRAAPLVLVSQMH